MKRVFVLVIVLMALSITGSGQLAGNPENWCRGGFFTRESNEFRVGVVKGTKNQKAFFYGDDEDSCPGPACRQKAYLVPGDEVIVNRDYKGYSCGWYTSSAGRVTVGWVETSRLDFPERIIDGSTRAWSGAWSYAENSIELTPDGDGWLRVKGNAFWQGLGDNVHIGELDGRSAPDRGILEYSDGDDEYDCKATMRLLGDFLAVADNNYCGGANVSFSGIYRRVPIK